MYTSGVFRNYAKSMYVELIGFPPASFSMIPSFRSISIVVSRIDDASARASQPRNLRLTFKAGACNARCAQYVSISTFTRITHTACVTKCVSYVWRIAERAPNGAYASNECDIHVPWLALTVVECVTGREQFPRARRRKQAINYHGNDVAKQFASTITNVNVWTIQFSPQWNSLRFRLREAKKSCVPLRERKKRQGSANLYYT